LKVPGPQLLDAYTKAGETAKFTVLLEELLVDVRKTLPNGSPELAGQMTMYGSQMLGIGAFADAEPILRECLAIREKTQPDLWSTFNTQSVLGGALLGQKKYADSEPVLYKLVMPNDVKQISLFCEIGSQYLALREYATAERLCRECVSEYTRLEQNGRVLLPTLKKQAQYTLGVRSLDDPDIVASTTTPALRRPIACDSVLPD
jgi:hypothetical protein